MRLPAFSNTLLWRDATGKGVRIAVIDSGVHAAHPHVNGVAGSIAIGREGASAEDTLGHGTAVLAAIKEKAPAADYLAIRIYYESLRTTIVRLADGFRWAVDQQVDVINLSLGTTNVKHRPLMEQLLDEAASHGIVVVAAADADGVAALPGSLPGALSVAVDWECPRDTFRCQPSETGLRWTASGYPRPLPGVPPRRNLYGVSFAVASMSGFAARACEILAPEARSKAAVEALLQAEALRA